VTVTERCGPPGLKPVVSVDAAQCAQRWPGHQTGRRAGSSRRWSPRVTAAPDLSPPGPGRTVRRHPPPAAVNGRRPGPPAGPAPATTGRPNRGGQRDLGGPICRRCTRANGADRARPRMCGNRLHGWIRCVGRNPAVSTVGGPGGEGGRLGQRNPELGRHHQRARRPARECGAECAWSAHGALPSQTIPTAAAGSGRARTTQSRFDRERARVGTLSRPICAATKASFPRVPGAVHTTVGKEHPSGSLPRRQANTTRQRSHASMSKRRWLVLIHSERSRCCRLMYVYGLAA
jgi:hypothetical protein